MILALDPGVTTGYAIFNDELELVASGNLELDDFDGSILAYIRPTNVVREFVPFRPGSAIGRQVYEVEKWLDGHFPGTTIIKPSAWKTNKLITDQKFPANMFPHPTPHQRDAYHIGLYLITFGSLHASS